MENWCRIQFKVWNLDADENDTTSTTNPNPFEIQDGAQILAVVGKRKKSSVDDGFVDDVTPHTVVDEVHDKLVTNPSQGGLLGPNPLRDSTLGTNPLRDSTLGTNPLRDSTLGTSSSREHSNLVTNPLQGFIMHVMVHNNQELSSPPPIDGEGLNSFGLGLGEKRIFPRNVKSEFESLEVARK